ncbi:MAG: hypothetical protein ACTSRS_08630 [Candidatus Helarchaeota archaeon]
MVENRRIKKNLYDLAMKEYKSKRLKEINGYHVKKAVLLQRGYGPSIIVAGLKGQIVPYILLADYGDHYRLYYLLENGVIINAINVSKSEFDRDRLKFEKATTKLFQIPAPELPPKRVEKLKKQLNEKFHHYLLQLEKETSCKKRTIPIITIYQATNETKTIIKREQDFIKFPVSLVMHKLLDGLLWREAYRLLIPSFVKASEYANLLTILGTYFHIQPSQRKFWLNYWEPKLKLKLTAVKMNNSLFNSFLQFLCFLGKYEEKKLKDAQIERILTRFQNLSKKDISLTELAAQIYLELANHEGSFNIKAALFFILSDQFKTALKILKELSHFSQTEEIEQFRQAAEYLASLQLSKIYSKPMQLKVNTALSNLFMETLKFVKTRIIEIRRIHKPRGTYSQPLKIQLKLQNHSDLMLRNIKIIDQLPKKSEATVLTSNTFSLPKLPPKKDISVEYEVLFTKSQKFVFNRGRLIFEDEFQNTYSQSIPTTSLKVR